ncbi:protein SFI1 homolog [Haliotis asinina]|uniref:protein SFI1 homolog n=1 Tax=Haliotis asinina TaxID=109174 RepID=UPI003531CEAA
MDRRDFKKVASENGLSNAVMKAEQYSAQGQNADRVQAKRAILQELGADLSIRAERMRLKTRILSDGSTRHDNGALEGETNTETYRPTPVVPGVQGLRGVVNSPTRIPVSQARQRRREKERSMNKQLKSNINIQNYRPDYMWNRGGRVKELRIRCIARKFLHLWIKNVFGRVTLFKARTHFNNRLLKMMFGVWYDMWWELRKEWRLQVRAECHHRYVLWSHSFQAWKYFVQIQRVKKAKFFRAQRHYVLHRESQVMRCWVQYVRQRREVKQVQEQASNFRRGCQLRWAWRQWQVQINLSRERHEMDSIALQFWAYRIQAQHWLLWHEAFQKRQLDKQKVLHAYRHQNSVLATRCLHAWILYYRTRMEKKKHYAYAAKLYQTVLKSRYLHQWHQHLALRQSLARHQDHIQHLAYRFTLRRYMQHWKQYVYGCRAARKKAKVADQHYRHHLLVVGVSAFRLYGVQQRLQAMRQRMAEHLHHRQVMRRVWSRWLMQCETHEELKMMPHTQKARKHYSCVLLGKSLQALQNYAHWRHHRKSQYSRADAHFYLHVMPQCVFRMRVFVQMEKNNRENQEKAVQFRRESLAVRFFTQWQKALENSREHRMLERMAILHDEDNTCQRFFRMWRGRTVDRLEENQKTELAGQHYCISLCVRHLRAWKRHIDDLKHSEMNEVKAVRHDYLAVMKKCFTKWKSYNMHRKEKHCLKLKASSHLKAKLFKMTIAHWKSYVDQMKKVNVIADKCYQQKCVEHLRWAFCLWQENASLQVAERHRESQASVHHNRYLLVKVMRIWHRFAAIHAYKKSETRHLEEDAKTELNKSKLQRYLRRWCDARDAAVIARLRWQQAVEHHQHSVMKAVVSEWKEHTRLNIRKTLLRRQSTWFLNVRLTAKSFLLWRERMSESEDMKQKTDLALWHWCLVLLKKSMVSWYVYSQERRRKKQRVAEALEGRRLRLLRSGAAQWLRVSNDLAGMRAKFAAQQQAKSVFDTFQVVQKFALHWKYMTARRREVRGGPLPPRPQPPCQTHQPQPPDQHSSIQTSFPQHPSDLHSYPLHLNPLPPKALVPHPQRTGAPLPHLTQTISPCRVHHRQETGQGDGPAPISRRERARPRQPAFLIESLKRAGLYASVYEMSDEAGQGEPSAVSAPHHLYTPQLPMSNTSNVPNLAVFGEDTLPPHNTVLPQDKMPSLGQHSHSPRVVPEMQRHGNNPRIVLEMQGQGHSPRVVSKRQSRSPIEMHQREVQQHSRSVGLHDQGPHHNLHLSSTSDGEFAPPANFVSPSCSTQRSQPSGNPLLYSSPKAEAIRHHEHYTDQSGRTERNIISGNLDDLAPGRTMLLTPDDFIKKSDRPEEFQARNGDRVSFDSSQQTGTNMYLDFSTVRDVKQSEVKISLSPAEEIIQIRDQLKSFDEMKKRLRRLTKQHRQLAGLLTDQDVGDETDEDVINARRELQVLSCEMEELRVAVDRQKGACQQLIARAKQLVEQLDNSS